MSTPDDKPQRRRRGHGEGSITYDAKHDRWVARINLGYVNGKRKRKAVYGKTRKEAAEQLKRLLADQQQGRNVAPERQTVAQYLDRWLGFVAQRLAPLTHQRYALAVRCHIVPFIGRVQLSALQPQHVADMMTALLEATKEDGTRRYSPGTVSQARAILRSALSQALKWKLVYENAAAQVDPPKTEESHARALTPDEAKQLLQAAGADRLQGLIRIGLSMGLRLGEALGLRWEDVDFDAGTISIRQTLQFVNNRPTFGSPKTKRSRRTLPLPSSMVTSLRIHKAHQLEDKLLAGANWQEHGLVFPSTTGTPMNLSNLYRAFHKLLERAGLPRMRFHDLRHSYATLLAAQGVPPRDAMELLGHSDISITLGIYTHAYDQSKRDAAEALDHLFDWYSA